MDIEGITQTLLQHILTHGQWSVFVGVLIESIIIPIPSPLIIMGAGALLISPEASWPQALFQILQRIVLPGSIASTLGAFIGYGIGFWGGKPLVKRWQGYLGFGWDQVMTMEQRLKRHHPGRVLFLLRALPVVPLSLISIAAGFLRWPAHSFAGWTWLGSLVRCLLLGYLGWATREAYANLAERLDTVESFFFCAIVLGIVGLILWLRVRIQQAKKTLDKSSGKI